MKNRYADFTWTFIGSLIITVGSTMAGIYSFRGEIVLVIVGFSLFILGYRVSQMGIHSGESGFLEELIPKNDSDSLTKMFSRTVFLLLGIVGIATGVTLFTQTILYPGTGKAALSGVASIGGYMSAHVGINGVGLGRSFVETFQDITQGEEGEEQNTDDEVVESHEGPEPDAQTPTWRWIGLLAGMAITSISLSSGFIWACGSRCISDPVIWTEARHGFLVVTAAFLAWWGYLMAHYAWTGSFIDKSAHSTDDDHDHADGQIETPWLRRAGVLFGVSILVTGMVIGVIFIRQGNHIMTNIGGALFLGGYLIGHYVETGNPL